MRYIVLALLVACATAAPRPAEPNPRGEAPPSYSEARRPGGESDRDVVGNWELWFCDVAPCTREAANKVLVLVLSSDEINVGADPVYGRSAEERTGRANGCVAEFEGPLKRDGAALHWAREDGLITFVPSQWLYSETIVSARFAGGAVTGVSEWSSRKRGDDRRRVQHVAGMRIGPLDLFPCRLVAEPRPIP